MNNQEHAKKISDVELVIVAGKRIEHYLKQELGAEGKNFHERIDAVQGRLPDELVRRLKYIAVMRNKIAFDFGTNRLDDRDRSRFEDAVKFVESGLKETRENWIAISSVPVGTPSGSTTGGDSRCFIATSVFEGTEHRAVLSLREFRDQVLMRSGYGVSIVSFYYRVSPPIAKWLDYHPVVRKPLKPLLNLVVLILR